LSNAEWVKSSYTREPWPTLYGRNIYLILNYNKCINKMYTKLYRHCQHDYRNHETIMKLGCSKQCQQSFCILHNFTAAQLGLSIHAVNKTNGNLDRKSTVFTHASINHRLRPLPQWIHIDELWQSSPFETHILSIHKLISTSVKLLSCKVYKGWNTIYWIC
jgi:hypothetical protein